MKSDNCFMNTTSSLILLSWTVHRKLQSNSNFSDISKAYFSYLQVLHSLLVRLKSRVGLQVVQSLISQSIPVPTLRQVQATAARCRLTQHQARQLYHYTKQARHMWACLAHTVLSHDMVPNLTLIKAG